ncbi:hypothetical protein FJQ98_16455 [Lysinibacillus agricola]|uniref:Uncharacterized protein n=1 Tax=Lysinibacillus agricola TaxID=2590012 RepID=A0ABX7AMW4_9BACI|nr:MULTISPECIES: hypothetical protein [Lysinibacillus]KOS61478.1 hypothetical protein AN161_17965 [Lysinibacillus sp. FJAT-14222]QQP10837.1 hypothetical protein FJQ98_16455 [Lysinibacillus agricola]
MSKESTIRLQIPTEVVRNIGFKIDEKSFAIYAFLLYQKFRSRDKNDPILQIDHVVMKNNLGINDNRTLKRCFKVLYDQKLIKNEISKFPTNGQLKVELLYPYRKDWFTQLPLKSLNRIEEIGHHGYRLMYYYESYINRNDISQDYCYPSYISIRDDLKISDDTLTKYNTQLKKLKLITITKHEVQFDNPLDENRFTRFNNHYRVNLFNV